jgi:hypothetical protein
MAHSHGRQASLGLCIEQRLDVLIIQLGELHAADVGLDMDSVDQLI